MQRSTRSLWASLTLIAALASCASSAAAGDKDQAKATDWPTFAFDAARRSCPDGSKLPLNGRVLWQFKPESPAPFMSSPSVVGDRLFIGGDCGNVYCLSTKTGELIWKFATRHIVFSSPVVAEGRVYFGEGLHTDEDCKLYCLEAAAGKRIWEIQTQGHTEGTPLLADGRVYFTGGPEGMICADARTGKRLWQFRDPHPDGSPLLLGKVLVFGSGYRDSGVWGVDADTGRKLWHVPVDIACWGTPAASPDGKVVYVGTGETRWGEKVESKPAQVLAIQAADGRVLWKFPTTAAVMSAALCVDGTVYAVSADGRLAALSAETGKPRWTRELKQWVLASPVWAGNGLVIVTQPGTVMLLDPTDGKTLKEWKLAAGDANFREGFVSTPALVGGRLYLAGLEGRIWCFGAAQP